MKDLLLLSLESSVASLAAAGGMAQYECPYGIKTRPHPFVTLLSARPDAWFPLLKVIEDLLRHASTTRPSSSQGKGKGAPTQQSQQAAAALPVVEFLGPFLRFVLLDPGSPADRLQLRPLLLALLSREAAVTASPHLQGKLLHFLLEILSNQSSLSERQVGNLASLASEFTRTLVTISTKGPSLSPAVAEVAGLFTKSLLGICLEYHCRGEPLSALLPLLQHLLTAGLVSEPQLVLLTLGIILPQSPTPQLVQILEILDVLLPSAKSGPVQPTKTLAATLVLPLVNITFGSEGAAIKTRASTLLNLMVEAASTKSGGVTLQVTTAGVTGRLAHLVAFARALEVVWNGANEQVLVGWFAQISRQAGDNSGSLLLSATLIPALTLHPEPAIRMTAATFVAQLVRLTPSQGLAILPLMLLRLNRETEVAVKHAILHAIPSLATDAFSVGPVLRTLQSVCNSAPMVPLSIRLMFKLWRAQERTFPHLLSTMQAALKSLAPGTRLSGETALSISLTIW